MTKKSENAPVKRIANNDPSWLLPIISTAIILIVATLILTQGSVATALGVGFISAALGVFSSFFARQQQAQEADIKLKYPDFVNQELLNQEIDEKCQLKKKLEEEVKAVESQLSNLESQKAELESVEASLSSKNKEFEELQQKHQYLETAVKELEERAKEEVQMLRTEQERLLAETEKLEVAAGELSKQNDFLRQQIQEKFQEIQNQEKELISVEASLTVKKQELEETQQKYQAWRVELKELEDKVTKIETLPVTKEKTTQIEKISRNPTNSGLVKTTFKQKQQELANLYYKPKEVKEDLDTWML